MGRLVLIIMVLFSVTAIYSEAHAAAHGGSEQIIDRPATAIQPSSQL